MNTSTNTLTCFSVAYTGELWRQSDLPKTVSFYYYLDPAGPTSIFTTNYTAWVTNLNIAFPYRLRGLERRRRGRHSRHQPDQPRCPQCSPITNGWASGAALWLAWEMLDDTGKAQGHRHRQPVLCRIHPAHVISP